MASKTKRPVLAATYGRRLQTSSPPVCGGRESVLAHGGQTGYNQKKDTAKGGGAMTQLTQAAHGAGLWMWLWLRVCAAFTGLAALCAVTDAISLLAVWQTYEETSI